MTDTEAKAQALVSIDPKALEHACLCAGRSVHHFDRMGDDLPLRASIVAHARAIERLEATEARHAAELREQAERFSEVAVRVKRLIEEAKLSRLMYDWSDDSKPSFIVDALDPFIIPAPDPLVEAVNEAWGWRNPHPDVTENLRAAMQARGYEWRKIGEAGE